MSVKEAERIKQTKGSPVGLTLMFTHSQDAEFLCLSTKMIARNTWT